MKEIQTILTLISIITKKNAKLINAVGGNFNIFQVLGVNHYEPTHSAILAEFLNPDGSHGLKGAFLKAFIQSFCSPDFKDLIDCEDCSVTPEMSTGDGRMDIVIKDKKGCAIIIENKIYANDQYLQLKRYSAFAEKNFGLNRYQMFYLTLDGSEASPQSGENVPYKTISYAEDIVQWLNQCVNISSRFPLVRETIIQYINHIKELTNQDMSTINSEEVVKLLIKPENIEATVAILKNRLEIFRTLTTKIIKEKLKPQMEQFAKDNDLTLSMVEGDETHLEILFETPQWKKCFLRFNTENRNLYGFVYKDSQNKIDDQTAETLINRIPKSRTNNWWALWRYTDDYTHIDIDLWVNDINNGKFGEYLTRIFTELLKNSSDLPL